ncbi:MAG TPA: galactose-1-phosphate uridylyltransferase [Streptosporangiaceae bacterium]|nr:galactose-1-phosphate uridylyltransferase [Streptosporangiaceae bacterium]
MTAGVWKSSTRLADGREIIYFDESPGTGRASVPDSRHLGGPAGQAPGGELRLDALTGDQIAIAEHRQGRTFLPAADSCPLCPSTPGHATEIPAPSYDVVVFQNRFPAMPAGQGRCEVVCFTAEHDASFGSLSPHRVQTVLAAWADRTAELGSAEGIEHVYCFENRGEEIGVTLHHPHGQVYALPYVPPRSRQQLASARAHRARTGRNLFDDMLAAEQADGRRIIARNEHWTALVPWAPHWPFEVRLHPAERVADLAALSAAARAAFAGVYLDVLRRLDALFGAPMPYMACWQQAPARDAAARAEFGLHLQVLAVRRAPGKLKFMAGTETGAGIWSNDVLPETAARMLREALS